jgi:mannosyltransferase OCH1-like enzyme
MIPKIIHQIGPKDKNLWHPIWKRGHESWKRNFPQPEFKNILWEDKDQIDNLIKNEFSNHWEYYQQLPMHMLKIDFARLCILYLYGGIFADLDFYCYSNFYSELIDDLYVLESFENEYTIVENPLMAASPKNHFFLDCLEKSKENYKILEETKIFTIDDPEYEHGIAGPMLINMMYNESNYKISKLPRDLYNPFFDEYNPSIKTKHFGTGMWGIDTIEDILDRYKINNSNEDSFYNHYNQYRISEFPKIKKHLNDLEMFF